MIRAHEPSAPTTNLMKTFTLMLATTAVAAAALPAVGPDYQRPSVPQASGWRDTEGLTAWKVAAPADGLDRGAWWKLFADPELDGLEARALAASPSLAAAAARVEQARASAGLARSSYWPQVAADGSLVRQRTSRAVDNPLPVSIGNTYTAPLTATWEIDLFGRVRRLSESARAEAEASAANFAAARLSLTAEVASTYFTLRALEREQAIVHDTVALRQRALELVRTRVRLGTAADLDAARAETELASTEADAAALANQHAAAQNALATLVGEPAPGFTLARAAGAASTPPAVPGAMPAELLERRPDVAAAERSLAAANARIGVAKAAFFPAISLTGAAGYASGDVDRLFNADARVWSIGPSVYLPIFQGGRNRANLARSRAAYDEAVAEFRQRVLVAFRDVQDALSATRYLGEEAVAQDRALAAARRTLALVQVRYDAGYVSYFEVIDAQRTALATERASVALTALRLNTSVALIKALGGGWHGPAGTLAANP